MLTQASVIEAFNSNITKAVSLEKSCKSLIRGEKNINTHFYDYYATIKNILDYFIIDAKSRTSAKGFHKELFNAKKLAFKADFFILVEGLLVSKYKLVYFISLCELLEINYKDLV